METAKVDTNMAMDSKQVPIRKSATLLYVLIGIGFGFVITKSEVVSWFRIQEMFRFQSFHMYGMLGGAVVVASLSLFLIRKLNVTDLAGNPIVVNPKTWGKGVRYWLGGMIFGFGWAFTGACPGPIFALLGSGVQVIVVVLLSAVAGSWVYGALRPVLPH